MMHHEFEQHAYSQMYKGPWDVSLLSFPQKKSWIRLWAERHADSFAQCCRILSEYAAGAGFISLMIFNLLTNNDHSNDWKNEQQRLYEQEKLRKEREREREEKEQDEFEERKRLYYLRFGNWTERQLSVKTSDELEEADSLRNSRGAKVEIVDLEHKIRVRDQKQIDSMRHELSRRERELCTLAKDLAHWQREDALNRYEKNASNEARYRVQDLLGQISATRAYIDDAHCNLKKISM